MSLENLLLSGRRVESHRADCSGTNGRSESSMKYVAWKPNVQDRLQVSQAEYAIVDWGTRAFS